MNITCSFPVERDNSGTLLVEARCEMCNGNATAWSVPNSSGDRYVTNTAVSSNFTVTSEETRSNPIEL